MCEQCQTFDDEDDVDALAHAFLQRQGKAAPAKPASRDHALLNRQVPSAQPPARKAVT